MKSKNSLTISGKVAKVFPRSNNTAFILAHNFGGKTGPLRLYCLFPYVPIHFGLKVGQEITIEASIKPAVQGIMVIVNGIKYL